jgi:beta-N-acetylhexosaminidase
MTTGDVYKRAESMGGLHAYFERYPIGGVFIGGEVIKDADKAVEQVLAVVNELNEASPRPLTFHGDFEWGVGQNVKGLPELPSIMAMASANVEQLGYDYGAAIASDARRIGAHASYSPVADLNVNPFNQITSVRSAGDDPEKVIPLLRALVRGMQDGGVSATAKHFPGDGFDFRNQHFVTSENPLSLETWREWSGAVFQALVNEGVHMIMAGHIALPSYQKERILELAPPATLSEELMTGLLKREMGFEGVIVSDALMMGGFLTWYEDRREAELQCLRAGCDYLLWPLPESLDYMEEAARDGRLSEERLDDAMRRIEKQREIHGLAPRKEQVEAKAGEGEQPARSVQETAVKIAERSIHLEWDRSSLLPLSADRFKSALLVIGTATETNAQKLELTAELLRERGLSVDVEAKMGVNVLKDRYEKYDLVIFAFSSLGFSSIDLAQQPEAKGAVWEALCYGREKSIVLSYGSPYIHEQYFRLAPTAINVWSVAEASQRAAVQAVFGELPFAGTRPVAETAAAEAQLRHLT